MSSMPGEAANILRLIIGPAVRCQSLQDDFFGMRAVAQQRRHRDQHSHNGHGERNWREFGIFLGVLSVLLEFGEFFGHCPTLPSLSR